MPTGAGAERVARGRAVAEAERETAGVTADRLRVGVPTSVAAAAPTAGAAQEAAEGAAVGSTTRAHARVPTTPQARQDAMMVQRRSDAVAQSCVRIDSPDADARWADQRFPLVLVVDSGTVTAPRNAAVMTVAGQPTELRATWRPGQGDSVSVALRRIGFSGSIVLGPGQGARAGMAVSAAAPTTVQEEAVAVAPSAQSRARADGAREEARKSAAAPQPAPAGGPPLRQLRVTARAIPCPQ